MGRKGREKPGSCLLYTSIEMADGYYTNGNQAGEAIVSMLADIGVKAEVVFTDKFSFSADIRAW